MILFTCDEEIMKLAVQSCKKYHSLQSAPSLSNYQNILKNCPFKKHISKIAPSKNTFSKTSYILGGNLKTLKFKNLLYMFSNFFFFFFVDRVVFKHKRKRKKFLILYD